MDCQIKICPEKLVEEILFKDVKNGLDWINIENLLGCLINNIDL